MTHNARNISDTRGTASSSDDLLPKRSVKNPLNSWLGYLLQRAATAAKSELAHELRSVDLRMVDASVLLLIEGNPDIIASKIGKMLDIKTANMVPLLRSLEDKGLVERVPINKKSHGLHLTEEGEAVLGRTTRVLTKFETELEMRVPEEHRPHIVPALKALWEATEAARLKS